METDNKHTINRDTDERIVFENNETSGRAIAAMAKIKTVTPWLKENHFLEDLLLNTYGKETGKEGILHSLLPKLNSLQHEYTGVYIMQNTKVRGRDIYYAKYYGKGEGGNGQRWKIMKLGVKGKKWKRGKKKEGKLF